MSDVHVAILENIVAQYEADLRKAERDFDKAKKKLEFAKTQLSVGRDMLEKAREGSAVTPPAKSLGDLVEEIVNDSSDWISAKDIHARLAKGGQNVDIAKVHVAADRLADSEKIDRDKTPEGKFYRRSLLLTSEEEIT